MKERTQEKMVLYWRVAGVTLVGGGEPWVKPIATEGESVAGLMLGNEDVPQIFFLFSFFFFQDESLCQEGRREEEVERSRRRKGHRKKPRLGRA